MGGKNVGRKFEKNASQSVKKEGGGARKNAESLGRKTEE